MTKNEKELLNTFAEVLNDYDEQLANNNLGVLLGTSFKDHRDRGANIFLSIIGFIVGIFTGFGFFSTTDDLIGFTVLTNEGVHFLTTEEGKKGAKTTVDGHVFLPFDNMYKMILTRSIIMFRELHLFGRYINNSGNEVGYRLEITISSNKEEYIEGIKNKLEERDIRVKKGRKLLALAIALVIIVGVIMLHNARARDINGGATATGPVVAVVGDIYTSASGDFQITFVDAFLDTAGVGQHQSDVIIIHFDYLAFTAHSAGRPFRDFVIYEGDNVLEAWDGGLRASDRGLITLQSLESGQLFYAKTAVVPLEEPELIRIVKYNQNGEVTFTHELTVRSLE